MRVERHDTKPSEWQTRIIEDHVLTLFLAPTTILHTADGSSVRSISLEQGSIVSSLRLQQESIRWTKPGCILSVALANSALREIADELRLHGEIEILSSPSLDDTRLRSLLLTLDAERQYGYPSGRLFVDGIERALASILINSYAVNKLSPQSMRGGLAPHVLARVIEFMQENLYREIALKELASCAGLSSAHFSRQFRESTGNSPHRHLLKLRIDLCKKLLLDPRLSILEVALSAGFQYPQHLAMVFRRLTGVSPSTYRRQR